VERIQNIHFVGIGGIGMSGIAEVMLNQGYSISGSDVAENANTVRLSTMGGTIHIGHNDSNISNADVVVISSAISDDNPEIIGARDRGIPVIPRAEMLSELMRKKYSIAVSGTHGKTTTTSMIASMLDCSGVNPTYVIGGRLLSNDKNASLGSGEYFVVEADESDGSFLMFHPVVAVVTNIDNDHLGVYKGDMVNLIEAFEKFVSDIPFYGVAIACIDDEHVAAIVEKIHRRVITYGFSSDAAVHGQEVQQSSSGLRMRVVSERFSVNRELKMRLHGNHNALNALASICVGFELGINEDKIFSALEEFEGISRRFNVYSIMLTNKRNVTVVDDYGHHPTEINNVLGTISDVFPGRRVIFVFEPHRYSRVKALFDAFVESLLRADYQLVLPVYAASEKELQGFSSSDICASLRSMGAEDAHSVSSHHSAIEVLDRVVEDSDVVLFMGAGGIGGLVDYFVSSGKMAAANEK